MLARIRKSMDNKDEGFTLIELLVVIIIIGILAAIAIPVFLNQRKKGYDAAVKSDLRNIATAEETILTDGSSYTSNSGTTATDPLVVAGFKPTTGVTIDTLKTYGTGNSDSFCIVAHNSKGGLFWKYDSANGGLNATGGATAADVPCA